MISLHNLYTLKEPETDSERFTPLFENSVCRIEAIRSHLTKPGEWYDQEEDEWVILIEGEAVLEVEGAEHTLHKGDCFHLPKHTRHRVLSTSENALWIGVFSS